eukprot:CAMPEP_0202888918 /NCGR_PEP_ID=MMETSP1391-20130828/43437_1 /ASSEMBLY_ACC=CAM_ASM_000867 /TAXON_ID=1034604 /ORGANISM="Chlamydomonas leiostraca, Strain SAG 11-49" /LENGTH=51 /DNA_ID=CAMNT_0049572233 /DNA_START=555 /DNA_END=710 /DNA_ORIENTATION=+
MNPKTCSAVNPACWLELPHHSDAPKAAGNLYETIPLPQQQPAPKAVMWGGQ